MKTRLKNFIGLLDSGVDGSHHMLQNRIAEVISLNESGNSNHRVYHDPQGHGTHTAGLICAGASGSDESSYQLKVAGVPMNQKTILSLLRGLDQLLNWDIRIACLPIGIKGKTPIFRPFIDLLSERGVLVIVPVGNDGDGRFRSPGWYPNVLSVGAIDSQDQPAKFSGSFYDEEGNCLKPDVLAPGVDMVSSLPGNKSGKRSGTSMACAYVAGVAAQLLVEQPALTAETIIEMLVSQSIDIPELPDHYYNYNKPIIKTGKFAGPKTRPVPGDQLSIQSSWEETSPQYLDPYFIRKYEGSRPDEELEGVIVVEDFTFLENIRNWEGLISVKKFKNAPMAHVVGSKYFFDEIISVPEMTMISAVDVDLFYGM